MNSPPVLPWPPLIPGVLIRRYKRFLADVRLEDGAEVTAHCPNSGKMTACCQPGRPVWISRHDNPRRKLKYTWELIEMADSLAGVNTNVPNRLVADAVAAGAVPELSGYDAVRREVKVGEHSRIDIRLDGPERPPCFVEVKNCTLVENGVAAFPDAVTARGLKHLHELRTLAATGTRSVIFFLIQRMDAEVFRPADEVDAAYGAGLRDVLEAGVEALAYDVHIDLSGIRLRRRLPVSLDFDGISP
ncbi:MAG: DNA/RNA nuclease SfsA [Desulfococcaceae bacterium]